MTGLKYEIEEEEGTIDREKLRDSLDAEVKRVSDLFRFILKYQKHFQPSGIEFSGLRQYLQSDDASRIDWKISAGKDDLYVKQYEEENDMDVFVAIDASETMLFGTSDKLKTEYAAVMGATIAYASVDAGINVGFGIYGPETRFVTPDGGMKQYHRLLYELTEFGNYGGKLDMEEVLENLIGQIQQNTAVFILSDMIDVEGDWKPKMKLASEKFRHVMLLMTRDLRDYRLPEAGNVRFESPYGDRQEIHNTNTVKRAFEAEADRREQEIREKATSAGADFMKIDTRDSFSARFAEYFEEHKERW